MIASSEKRREVFEQAARWFLWLRDHKADPAEVEVFQRWRSSSGKNRRAYEKVEHLWQACNGINELDLPWPTELELEQDQYDGSYALPVPGNRDPLAGINESSAEAFVLAKKPGWRQKWGTNWRMAASICVMAVAVSLSAPKIVDLIDKSSDPYFTTSVAQQRVEVLEDGSVITLGGATRLVVNFDRSSRQVVLEQGEAYFQVAKDSTRPFRVLVGNSEVRAIGTAFNVNRRSDAVTVSVVEGVVDVSQNGLAPASVSADIETAEIVRQERLTKGQELIFDRGGELWQAAQDRSLERATAWREGRLAYVNERLDHVLQDVNRYSMQKLVIGDLELGDLRYTGTVFSKDIAAWLKGLEQAFSLRMLTVDGNTVLLRDNSKRS